MNRALKRLGPALLLSLLLVAAWELYVDAAAVQSALLPAPHEVASALWNGGSLLWRNFAVTAEEVALGLAIALAAGLALATVIHLSPLARRAVYPLAVGSQAGKIDRVETGLFFSQPF